MNWIRAIWAAASTFEKVLLTFFPLAAVWDLIHLNLFDLVVAVAVVAWIVYDIHEDTTNGRD